MTENSRPMVSIGVPIYKAESYIERCVRSLFNQTYDNIEYIFVDDASPDNSISLLTTLIESFPQKNTTLIQHSTNLGIAQSRNNIIDTAKGQYLIWVDADDWVDSIFVQTAIEQILSKKADVACLSYKVHSCSNSTIVRYPSFDNPESYCLSILQSRSPYEVWNKIARITLYKEHNIHAIDGNNVAEDFVISSLLLHHSKKTITINEPLYNYNQVNPNSITKSNEEYRYYCYWESFDYLKKIFHEFEAERVALTKTEAFHCSSDLVKFCKDPQKQYYYLSQARIVFIPRSVIKTLSYPRQLLLKLSPIKWLLRAYGLFAIFIKDHFHVDFE